MRSDEETLSALRRGDEQVFVELVQQHHALMLRVASHYVRSRTVAEEVVQETWLAVIGGIDRFELRSSLKTWLFRIMLNIARSNGVRESRSIPFATTAVLDDEPAVDADRFRRFTLRGRGQWKRPPDPWTQPEQQLLEAETHGVILRAVASLPAAQREVLTMRDLLGWTAAETCEALELSDANQRVLLHRARSRIRSALERQYDSDPER